MLMFGKDSWKSRCLRAEAEAESAKNALKALFEDARAVNNIIRRNADQGNLEHLMVSPFEIDALHSMRKKMADFYGSGIECFENSAWLLKKIIEGTDEETASSKR